MHEVKKIFALLDLWHHIQKWKILFPIQLRLFTPV